jgi:phage gp29-like protein
MIKINQKLGYTRINFNPSAYKRAYDQYMQGYHRDLIAMMQQAAVDSHVAGCLKGRRSGFQRPVNIIPYDESEASTQRAEWLRAVISNLGERNLLKSIFEAVLYKYVVLDFEWEVIEGKQVPVNFKKFNQRFFKYQDERLVIDLERSFAEIPETALVAENPESPEMLPVLRDYILKDFGIESWASFLETFGEGVIIGYYAPGASKDVRDELETAVNAIAGSSRGIAPQGSQIEIKEAQRTTGDHEKFARYADNGISITLLGHANAVEQSHAQIGENLSAYEVRREIAIDDMYFLESQVQKLVRILIDRNFGDGKYPVYRLDKSEPVDVTQAINVIDMAYRHGVKISPDEYRKVGLYVYDDQEPIQRTDPFAGE